MSLFPPFTDEHTITLQKSTTILTKHIKGLFTSTVYQVVYHLHKYDEHLLPIRVPKHIETHWHALCHPRKPGPQLTA